MSKYAYIIGGVVLVALLLYGLRPWRHFIRHDWTILNGGGPGQFKTPYSMTVFEASRYAATVGWSVIMVDHKRKVLLVKKRA